MYNDNDFPSFLLKKLEEISPDHNLRDIMKYSLLPAGKLFRPNIIFNLAQDLGAVTESHLILASSIEMHHTYTLIHDDLPSMDNDDYRRGRLSSHKKFTEWEAILAGDALINISYELLSQLKTKHLARILSSYSRFCGPRGLILGQVKDLGNENSSLKEIVKIHELKTSRLIQNSLINSATLSDRLDLIDDVSHIGKALGVNFQLLDDLCELTDDINQHEKNINPFLHYEPSSITALIKENTLQINSLLKKCDLKNLESYIELYMGATRDKLKKGKEKVNSYVKIELDFI
jgi:geranylgeranyl pyrophosphate synthase